LILRWCLSTIRLFFIQRIGVCVGRMDRCGSQLWSVFSSNIPSLKYEEFQRSTKQYCFSTLINCNVVSPVDVILNAFQKFSATRSGSNTTIWLLSSIRRSPSKISYWILTISEDSIQNWSLSGLFNNWSVYFSVLIILSRRISSSIQDCSCLLACYCVQNVFEYSIQLKIPVSMLSIHNVIRVAF